MVVSSVEFVVLTIIKQYSFDQQTNKTASADGNFLLALVFC